MTKNVKVALLTGANLALNAFAVMASANHSQTATQNVDSLHVVTGATATQVNAVSVASIEKSFIEVPATCKARNAAFDPVVVGSEQVSDAVLAIHSTLDQAIGAVA